MRRYLGHDVEFIDSAIIGPFFRKRVYCSNIPKATFDGTKSIIVQDILQNDRSCAVTKMNTVTTNQDSLKIGEILIKRIFSINLNI